MIIYKSFHTFQNSVFYIGVHFYFSQKGSFLFASASTTYKEKKGTENLDFKKKSQTFREGKKEKPKSFQPFVLNYQFKNPRILQV